MMLAVEQLSRHDPALTGLRAVAIIAVLIFHVGDVLPNKLLVGGWLGVDVFFVLSGFLITTILDREIARSGRVDIRRFYMNRAVRLLPALAPLLAATLVAGACLPGHGREALRATAVAMAYVMNWNMAFGWTSAFVLGHTWTLATELQFYLLWPLLYALVPAPYRLRCTVWLIVIVVAWRCALVLDGARASRTYAGLDTHIDAILIGCACAMLPQPKGRRVPASLALAVVLAFALLAAFLRYDTPLTRSVGMVATAAVAAGLLACARSDGWLRTVLMTRPVVYVGQISYGLYLWHYPALMLWAMFWPRVPVGVPITIAVALAVVSYHGIERPVQRAYRDRRSAGPSLMATPALETS